MVRVPRQLSLVITKINDCALVIPGNHASQLFSLASFSHLHQHFSTLVIVIIMIFWITIHSQSTSLILSSPFYNNNRSLTLSAHAQRGLQ